MTVAPTVNDNRLTLERRAVIFFFYLRFFKNAIITIIIATAKIASVVIICNI